MKQLFKPTKIGRLALKTPVLCASGTIGFLKEAKGLVDFNYIGAAITKTLTVEPRTGNKGIRIAEVECGMLNSIGLENPGIKAFLKEVYPGIQRTPTQIIVSIAGKTVDEFKTLGRLLFAEKTIKAAELNLSCPNVRGKIVSRYPHEVYRVVKAFKGQFKRTTIAKLTPEVTDITETASAAKKAGADALSLVNTFLGIKFDVKTRKPILENVYGGYSGKGIKPLALYKVWQVAQSLDIDIIGGGGINNWQDAVEFFLAGASAVSVGTATFIYPDTAEQIVKGLYRYMKENSICKLGKLELL